MVYDEDFGGNFFFGGRFFYGFKCFIFLIVLFVNIIFFGSWIEWDFLLLVY